MYSEASAPLHFYRLILQITLLHDVCLRIHRDDFTIAAIELAQIIVKFEPHPNRCRPLPHGRPAMAPGAMRQEVHVRL